VADAGARGALEQATACVCSPRARHGPGRWADRMSGLGSPVRAYDFLLKFLLVGDSDVGKGEILASLQDGAAESPYGHPAGERGRLVTRSPGREPAVCVGGVGGAGVAEPGRWSRSGGLGTGAARESRAPASPRVDPRAAPSFRRGVRGPSEQLDRSWVSRPGGDGGPNGREAGSRRWDLGKWTSREATFARVAFAKDTWPRYRGGEGRGDHRPTRLWLFGG
jgi:hypothetical protein